MAETGLKYQGSFTAIQTYQGVQYEITVSSDVMFDVPDMESTEEIVKNLGRAIMAQMYPHRYMTENEWDELSEASA